MIDFFHIVVDDKVIATNLPQNRLIEVEKIINELNGKILKCFLSGIQNILSYIPKKKPPSGGWLTRLVYLFFFLSDLSEWLYLFTKLQ